MAKDLYSQLAYIEVTESAANTLTFNGLSVFSNVLSQTGMVIHRIHYSFTVGVLGLLANTSDALNFGVVGDDQLSEITLGDARVYDGNTYARNDAGTAATAQFQRVPFVTDYTQLPGGGMLVPADRLFGYFQGASLGGAGSVLIRVYFTLLEMSSSDYLELAQALRVLR